MKNPIGIALFLCAICLAGCWESEPATKTDAPVTDLDQSISPSDGAVLEDDAGDGLLFDPGLPPEDTATDTNLPEDSTPVTAPFGIYFLADSEMNAWKAAEQDLDQLVLAPAPFLSDGDLSSYDTCNHVLKLTQAGAIHLQSALGTDIVPVYGRPFVVCAGTERIYLGAFWTAVSSVSFSHPIILMEQVKNANFQKLVIEAGYPSRQGNLDPRNDSRILAVLEAQGKTVDGCAVSVACVEKDCGPTQLCCHEGYGFSCKERDPNDMYVSGCGMMFMCDGPEDCAASERCFMYGSGILRTSCHLPSDMTQMGFFGFQVVCHEAANCAASEICKTMYPEVPMSVCEPNRNDADATGH